MKAVLMSIRPKWCELIASGKKTIEVRKMRPKIETPFKCYIYMTKGCATYPPITGGAKYSCNNVGGRCVIGEFVCDWIIEDIRGEFAVEFEDKGCVPIDKQREYSPKGKLYGWHTSNLKIYDKPRELCEFKKAGFMMEDDWLAALYPNTHCHYEAWAKRFEVACPPQSYMLVEELQ